MEKNEQKKANKPAAKKVKKVVYPSKNTVNLYYRDDKGKGVATMTVYGILLLVVGIAFAKFGVIDKLTELDKAKDAYEENQQLLVDQTLNLKGYDEVVSQYNRYCSSYLAPNEIFSDRLEVLKMLEETLFGIADVENITITSNQVSLNFNELTLADTADLVRTLREYKIVESIDVNSIATMEGSIPRVYMVIHLTQETGGEA